MRSHLLVIGIAGLIIVSIFSLCTHSGNARVICLDKYNNTRIVSCSDQNAIAKDNLRTAQLPASGHAKGYSISIGTDRISYVKGQTVKILGRVFDENGTPANTKVSVIIRLVDENSTQTMYRTSVFSKNGTYVVLQGLGGIRGTYNITASVQATNGEPAIASTTIELQELFFTRPFIILYVGFIIAFGGLLLLIIFRERTRFTTALKNLKLQLPSPIKPSGTGSQTSPLSTSNQSLDMSNQGSNQPGGETTPEGSKSDKQSQSYLPSKFDSTFAILQFVFLTILAITPIAALVFTDIEITPNSPIGVIIKPITTTNILHNATLAEQQLGGQWVINIGGSSNDRYTSGIQIPINVFIFGIAGGYLRYLYQTSRQSNEEQKQGSDKGPPKESHNDQDNGTKDESSVFLDTLQSIALIFLSPLLAMALWLVLTQGGQTSAFTLAAVSFTIGLITEEVVKTLVWFSKAVLQAFRERTGTTKHQ
jgi:hypothetical protein